MLISIGCKTSRQRGEREIVRTEDSTPTEKESPANERDRTEEFLRNRRSQLDSVNAELAIVEKEQKTRDGEPPSAKRDQAVQDLAIKKKMLQRDRKSLRQEIARLEGRLGDLPSGEMSEEESETDALLRMAEEEAFRQDELARAREAERRRRADESRLREERRRVEEAARREAETAKSIEVEIAAGPVEPFEDRYAATILRIRTKLADYKRW